jgi:glycine dehydrogenase subunit 2
MASIAKAYHASRGESEQRDEIITTLFSHPSDAAAPAVLGYKVVTIGQGENGLPDLEALKKAVSKRTAALFATNPEDTGIFNAKIDEFTKIVHRHGGLCTYDQCERHSGDHAGQGGRV